MTVGSSNLLKTMAGTKDICKFFAASVTGTKNNEILAGIERVFTAGDKRAEETAAKRGEFTKPKYRERLKENIDMTKEDMKETFRELKDKDVPKNLAEFNELVLDGLMQGILFGSVLAALALIPEELLAQENSGSSETPLPAPDNGATSKEFDEIVDNAFLIGEEFASIAAKNKDKLSKPAYREATIKEVNLIKEKMKTTFGSITENELPVKIGDAIGIFMNAFTFGMVVGIAKTALAIVPEPAVCPTPTVP